MANQVGKRYKCVKCGSEFIVVKGGTGTIICCGQPLEQNCGTEVLCTKSGDGEIVCCSVKMEEIKPRPLPSSD
jgi:desulfoferrodoxin-like iron-binding protein